MPPKRSADDRQKRFLARGGDMVALTAQEETPRLVLDRLKPQPIAGYQSTRKAFNRFFQSESATLPFPGNPSSTDEIFCPTTTGLDFKVLAAWLKWAITAAQAKRRARNELSLTSTLARMVNMSCLLKMTTGHYMDKTLKTQLCRLVTGELATTFKLDGKKAAKLFLTLDDMRDVVGGFFDDRHIELDSTARFACSSLTLNLLDASTRLGWFLPAPGANLSPTQWSHYKVHIFKMENADNAIVITGHEASAKTVNSKNVVGVWEQLEDRLLCPVFHFLVNAFNRGALPEGWTFETMNDPAIFEGNDSDAIDLVFNDAVASQPVY